MRHAKFFKDHPRADRKYFYKFTCEQLTLLRLPVWKQHRMEQVAHDHLAFRQMMLRDHGIESVQNSIYMDNGRNKRF